MDRPRKTFLDIVVIGRSAGARAEETCHGIGADPNGTLLSGDGASDVRSPI